MPVIDVLPLIDLTPQEPEPEVVVLPPLEPELVEIEEAPAVVARTITTQVAKPSDVADVDDVELALAIRERLGSDPRIANFGEQWLMEDRVPRFSRGDLRRLREYMQAMVDSHENVVDHLESRVDRNGAGGAYSGDAVGDNNAPARERGTTGAAAARSAAPLRWCS